MKIAKQSQPVLLSASGSTTLQAGATPQAVVCSRPWPPWGCRKVNCCDIRPFPQPSFCWTTTVCIPPLPLQLTTGPLLD